MSSLPSRIDRRQAKPEQPSQQQSNLYQLFAPGLHALLLMQAGCGPAPGSDFGEAMLRFLKQVEARARELGLEQEQIHDAKYVFCALVDEVVLGSGQALRQQWQSQPLQLRLFGDQLAGEHTFTKLDVWRQRGASARAVLEVFQVCLLMGFRGKYALDQSGRLAALCAILGDEIARVQGGMPGLAPHAARPDRIVHALGSQRGLRWVAAAACCSAALVFVSLYWSLHREADGILPQPDSLIRAPAKLPSFFLQFP